MIKKFTFFSLLFSLINSALFAQRYDYDFRKKAEHVGVFINPTVNTGGGMVKNDEGAGSVNGSLGVAFNLGAYYQYHLTSQTFVRLEIGFGTGSYGYKYANKYAPISDTSFAKFGTADVKDKLTSTYFKPKLEIGRQFYLTDKHILEIGLGIAPQFYMNKLEDDNWSFTSSETTLKNNDRVTFSVEEKKYIGNDKWGTMNGELYIGYRNKGRNEYFERLGIGLTYLHTFADKHAGATEFVFYNTKYNYYEGRQRAIMNNQQIGIKLSYNFF